MYEMNTKIKFGLSGDIASFSEEAALAYAKKAQIDMEPFYLMDMEGVLAALENQEIDLGIFPVMNLTGGLVNVAFEAMGKHLFQPVDELWLDVQQCLITLPGKQKEDIQSIVSHSQGLAQCQHYLAHHFSHIAQMEWIDTAKAAKDLSENKLSADTAVIASARAAEYYGLSIFERAIQDAQPNHTIFVIVAPLR
ncbi:MAG: chorismate mutase [Gammaproteobacteria bacterium]|jgi:prephenate dehydratase|nr:chorismate mutase [Gammaproteobacteria bacterium]